MKAVFFIARDVKGNKVLFEQVMQDDDAQYMVEHLVLHEGEELHVRNYVPVFQTMRPSYADNLPFRGPGQYGAAI